MEHDDQIAAPLTSHLSELRKRLAIIFITLVVGTGTALLFSKHLYAWLQQPLAQALPSSSTFVALSPLEGWLVYLKVAIVAALFATSPIWLYQLWSFIAPGLHRRERTAVMAMGGFSALLFIGGAACCYFLVIPYGFRYFASLLDGTSVTLMPQMNVYFSLMLRLLVAFGIAFQVPIVTVFLVRLNIVPLRAMKRARPYVVIGAFVLAAVITPPDVITQIALAIPFIALFEISLIVARILHR